MAAGLEGAIKELLAEQLKEITDAAATQDQKQQDMSKAIEELSGKIVERTQEADKMRESLDQFKKDLEDSNGKNQTQLGEDITAMKERLNKFEDDADGIGGLKQVHEKITTLEKGLGEDIQPKFEDCFRLVKENNTKTEEFDRTLRELSRTCEDITETLKVSEARVTAMEGISSTVGTAQEALEDSVSRKYEKLWEDVLHAIEEVKATQLDAVKGDLDGKNEAIKTETKSLVNYALNFMASAHGERRKMALNRSLVLAWKEQTHISSRRRLGIAHLHNIFQRRQRATWDTWHRRHDTSALCDRLHGQYTGQLKDVYRDMKAEDTKLTKRCDKLDGEVKTMLDGEKVQSMASKKSLDHAVHELQHKIQEELKAITQIKHTLKEHDGVHKKHDDLHKNHKRSEDDLGDNLKMVGKDLADVIEGCKQLAAKKEMQGMISDILMIWNSIKQLDTSKADKKDVDSFALETGNRDKLSSRRLEDFEADLLSKSRQDTLRMQEKWSELDGRMDESGRQFRHWEQMWEKLSGFVEDLVGKIGDLQGGADGKLPSATMRTPNMRAGSRDPVGRSRAEIPTLPTNDRNMSNNSGYAGESLETKMIWLNSAKGIVDSTIDQAIGGGTRTPSSAQPRSRPKSASRPESGVRRPHDRAR